MMVLVEINKMIFNESLISQLVSAFFGAFFAFMFMIILSKIKDGKDKKEKRINTLFRLQIILNEHLDINYRNLSAINGLIKIYENAMNKNKIRITNDSLENLNIYPDILYSLNYQILVNSIFSYKMDIDRLNTDINKCYNLYVLFRDSYINHKIKLSDYSINFGDYIEQLNIIKPFCIEIEYKLDIILARVRIYKKLEDKRRFSNKKIKENKVLEETIKQEIKLINEQKNQVKNESSPLSDTSDEEQVNKN